jgi:tetratricopeptide (TPR) repeat protein
VLALFLVKDGRPEEAQRFAARAVAMHRQVQGDQHPDTAFALLWLGESYLHQHKLADAEQAYRESLAVRSRAFGNRQPGEWTTNTLGRLVYALSAQFKDEEVETLWRESLTAWLKQDPTFREAAGILFDRGFACWYRGDEADAEVYFRQALEVARKTRGPMDPEVIVIQLWLGAVLFTQDKKEEASAVMHGILPLVRRAALHPDPPPELLIWQAPALVMGGSGKAEDLQDALKAAQRALEGLQSANPDYRAQALVALAMAHQANGDRDRAIEVLRQAQALVRPVALWERRLIETSLVKHLKEKDDRAAAEKVLRDELNKLQTALPKGDPEIAAVQGKLAALLLERQAHGEAAPLLLAADEILKAHPQAGSPSLQRRRTEALEHLVQLYDAWGQVDAAAKWRGELEALRLLRNDTKKAP